MWSVGQLRIIVVIYCYRLASASVISKQDNGVEQTLARVWISTTSYTTELITSVQPLDADDMH